MDRHGDAYSFGTTTITQKCIIMSTPSHATIFAGIDWGSRSHQVCVLDAEGTVLSEKAFPHSGEGLGQLLDSMADSAGCDPEHIAVAIEVPHGPVVDSLLDRGFKVFSINPKQLDRFRDRFSPAGAKDDRRDARVLADAVRTDPGCLRALDPLDADIVKLREWSRMADEQTTLRTALTHRLRAQLWRYYPQFLALGVPLSSPWVWAIWAIAPTPQKARRVRSASVAKVLQKHRIRRFKADEVLQTLRTQPIPVAPGVTEAATAHIRILVKQLELITAQINEIKGHIHAIIEALSESDDTPDNDEMASSGSPRTWPDAAILASLPGVGPVVLATLLSEASTRLHARDYRALRCLCGVAPVTRRSGKTHRVVRRKACPRRLVNAIYHWSRVAVQRDPVSRAKYRALRDRGHSHGRALRSIADRLLAIACAMLRNGTLYDPAYKNR